MRERNGKRIGCDIFDNQAQFDDTTAELKLRQKYRESKMLNYSQKKCYRSTTKNMNICKQEKKYF